MQNNRFNKQVTPKGYQKVEVLETLEKQNR